jgi:drug/metabolite transporter (DMT)-like permease
VSSGEVRVIWFGPTADQKDTNNMKPLSTARLKTPIAIFLLVFFGPVGNVLLSKGMKRIGPVSSASPKQLAHVLLLVLQSSTIWLGIGSLLAFFVTYILVVSWADYSYVQPASSLAYVVVTLLGRFALSETVSPISWMGVLLISLGVFVVGQTHPATTENKT